MNKLATRMKPILSNIRFGKYSFFTLDDLTKYIRDFSKQVTDYDAFIGIPRSGLFVALELGMIQGKQVYTPETYVKKQVGFGSIERDIKRVLLVDDSLSSGKTLQSIKKKIPDVDTAAIFVKKGKEHYLDHYYKVTGKHRIFEWNMMHKKWYRVGFDMDGVLCKNCPKHISKDRGKYRQWITEAKPFLIPSYKIDYIISNRLEEFREETEDWLSINNVKYDELILWDEGWDGRKGKYAKHKANEVGKHPLDVFIESNPYQAKKIWFQLGIPTICIDEMKLFS